MEKPGVIKRSLSLLILKIYMFMSALIHNYSLQLKNILFNDLFGCIFYPTCRVAVQLALSAYDSSQLQAGTEECYSLHLLCIRSVMAKLDILPPGTVVGVRATFPLASSLCINRNKKSTQKKLNEKQDKTKKPLKTVMYKSA